MFEELYNIVFGSIILLLAIFLLYWIPFCLVIRFLLKDKTIKKTIFFYVLLIIPIAVWLSLYLLIAVINLPVRKTLGNVFYEPAILGVCTAFIVRYSLNKYSSFNKEWFQKNTVFAMALAILIFLLFPSMGSGI
jgi:hypothetical protein